MDEMNEQVRAAVIRELERRGISRTEFAERVGKQLPDLSRMLNGRSGVIPEGWQAIFDELDMELVLLPRKRDE